MRQYSDATISDFFRDLTEDQRSKFLESWNKDRSKRERIYISYDSTNKNCEAGDIDIVEYGAAKVDVGQPVFNYAEPRLDVIREELEMCGYIAIISSEEMNFKKAIELYKSRNT